MAMYKTAFGIVNCAIALCVVSAVGAQARDIYAALPYEKSPGYFTAWPVSHDMGEAGYFGGSSGGIPGTGAPAYDPGYQRYDVGIPPEDRPYPVWTGPGRLLR
jgi:hypothetical protein